MCSAFLHLPSMGFKGITPGSCSLNYSFTFCKNKKLQPASQTSALPSPQHFWHGLRDHPVFLQKRTHPLVTCLTQAKYFPDVVRSTKCKHWPHLKPAKGAMAELNAHISASTSSTESCLPHQCPVGLCSEAADMAAGAPGWQRAMPACCGCSLEAQPVLARAEPVPEAAGRPWSCPWPT